MSVSNPNKQPLIGCIYVPEQHRKQLELTNYQIHGTQFNNFCNFNTEQTFRNTNKETIEITYLFPNDSKFCVYDSLFIVNGHEIKPHLRKKEEANEEYRQAVEDHHTALLSEDVGNGLCSFKLGNLPSGKEATIKLTFSFESDVTRDSFITKYPLCAKYQSGEVTSKNKTEVKNFNFSLTVNCPNFVIERITTNTKSTINSNKIEIPSYPSEDAIFITTSVKDGIKSIGISSDGYTLLNVFPKFETPTKLNNSEFVFLVDCSGSMSGRRIANASRCMNVFIKSLPLGCLFSIWRFGTRFTNEIKTCEYSEENIAKAINKIHELAADMGGTDLLEPLQAILDNEIPTGFVRQIFVLTDGEISNTDRVLAIVRQNRHKNRIFSIGVGSGADPGLITGLSKFTSGQCIQVDDGDPKFDEKVINMLSTAIQPGISSPTCVEGEGTSIREIWPSPLPTLYNESQQTIIFQSSLPSDALISGHCQNEAVDEVIKVCKISDSIGLKQYFSKKAIEDLQSDLILDSDNKSKKEKVIDLSIKSNVLSKYTSYIGVDFDSNVSSAEEDLYDLVFCSSARSTKPIKVLRSKAAPQCKSRRCVSPPPDTFQETDHFETDIIDTIIHNQRINGSWVSDFGILKSNHTLVCKYGQAAATTVAALTYLIKNAHERLGSLKLIIQKAYNFLKSVQAIDWESIVKEEINNI